MLRKQQIIGTRLASLPQTNDSTACFRNEPHLPSAGPITQTLRALLNLVTQLHALPLSSHVGALGRLWSSGSHTLVRVT